MVHGADPTDFSDVRTVHQLGAALHGLHMERSPQRSRVKLADAIGVQVSTISNWMDGRRFPRDPDKLRSLLVLLDARPAEITQILAAYRLIADTEDGTRPRPVPPSQPEPPRWSVIAPPVGAAPTVRGRDVLMETIVRTTTGAARGAVEILAGPGGCGKTAIALEAARRAASSGRRVWWLPASDGMVLHTAALTLAATLGARESDLARARQSSPYAIECLWALLGAQVQPWLLCFDDADDPLVLAPDTARLSRGTGWVRSSAGGSVLVTSRLTSRAAWPASATVHPVGLLDPSAGAQMLLDRIPGPHDDGVRAEARTISERLGNLPLAVHLAGRYLGSALTTTTPAQYAAALAEDTDTVVRLVDRGAELDVERGDPRSRLASTWDLSLGVLDRNGIPQARGILQVLSHLAPNRPIPVGLLDPAVLREHRIVDGDPERAVAVGLAGLAALGLVTAPDRQDCAAPTGHVSVHALVGQVVRSSTTDRDAPGSAAAAAVALLAAAVDRLAGTAAAASGNTTAWPQWRAIAGHVRAVLVAGRGSGLDVVERAVRLAVVVGEAIIEADDYAETEALYRLVLDTGRPLGEHHPVLLSVRGDLGFVRMLRGDYTEAEHLTREVLAARELLVDPDHEDVLTCRHNLGIILGHSGDHAQAQRLQRDVLAVRRRTLGPEHPVTLTTHSNLGLALYQAGRFDEAERCMREVLADRERASGPDHLHTLTARHNHARALASIGELDAAESACRSVCADRARLLGDDHVHTLLAVTSLGVVLLDRGKDAEAEPLLRNNLARLDRVLGVDHPHTVTARSQWERSRATHGS